MTNKTPTYKIVRNYRSDRRSHTVRGKTGLTLEQAHCQDPKTRKAGLWFDGYTEE